MRERMRRELGDPVFEAWIGPLNLESFEHDELKIGAAKPFVPTRTSAPNATRQGSGTSSQSPLRLLQREHAYTMFS